MMTASSIMESRGLYDLTRNQRILLLNELRRTIGPGIPDSFREELKRRVAEMDANPDDCIPWEEARQRLRERFGELEGELPIENPINLLEARNLDHLSLEEKMQLGHALLDAADAECSPAETPPALLDEIDRRVAEYDADPSIGIPWETVFDEAMQRLRK